MTWTPPADTSLSSADIDNVLAGLRSTDSRDAALAFLDEVTNPGLLYVIACEVQMDRWDKPNPGGTADAHRNFIRNRV